MNTIEENLKLLNEPKMDTDEFLENLDLALKKKRQAFDQEDRKRTREGQKLAQTLIRQNENKLKLQELEAIEAKMRYDGDDSAHHLLLARRKVLLDSIGDEPRIEAQNLTGTVTYVFTAKDLTRVRSQLAALHGTLPSSVRLVHNTTGQDATQDQVPDRSGEVLRLTAVNTESKQERKFSLRQDLEELVPFVSLSKIVEITVRVAAGDPEAGADLFEVLGNFSLQKPEKQKEDDDLWKAAMSRPAFGEEELVKVFKIVKQAFGLGENWSCLGYFRVSIERDAPRLLAAILAANVSPNAGRGSPLSMAIGFGRDALISALLKAHADATLEDHFETPLTQAIDNNRDFAVAELLRCGANPDYDPCGSTLLNRAVESGRDHILTLLLENKADPNFENFTITPLANAIRSGRDFMATQLLQWDADPNLSSGYSLTPLILAINNDNESLVAQLLRAKADPNLNSGASKPLSRAISKKNKAIIKQLRDAGAGQKNKQKPAVKIQEIKSTKITNTTKSN